MTSQTDHRIIISDLPFFPLLLERRPPGTSSAPLPAIMSDLGSALAFLRTGEFSLKLDRFFSRLDCQIIWYLKYHKKNSKTVASAPQPWSCVTTKLSLVEFKASAMVTAPAGRHFAKQVVAQVFLGGI